MRTNAKVYAMIGPDGRIKLGHSTDPQRRAGQIGRDVTVVHVTDVLEQAERIERLAHRVLALHGKHIRGEWFEASLNDVIMAIETAIKQAEGQELALGGKLNNEGRGRPPLDEQAMTARINIRIPVTMMLAIERVRDKRKDGADTAHVVRELLVEALEARGKL